MEIGSQVLVTLNVGSDNIEAASIRLPIFSIDGTQYQVCLTKGEGACGIHALLGEKFGDFYRFPGDDHTSSVRAKKHFTDAFVRALDESRNDALKQSFIEVVSNHFTQVEADWCSRMLFADIEKGQQLKTQWDQFHAECDKTLELAKNQEAALWLPLVEENHGGVMDAVMTEVAEENRRRGAESRYHELGRQKMLLLLQGNPSLLLNIVSSHSENFNRRAIGHKNAAAINAAQQERRDATGKLEQEEAAFIISREVVGHYVSVFNDPAFYLNTEEIKVGAFLFNKEVQVVATRSKGIIRSDKLFNEGAGGDRVIIHHEGAHFSRCLKVEDVPKEKPIVHIPSSSTQPHEKIADQEISELLDNGEGAMQLFEKAESGVSFSQTQLERLGSYFENSSAVDEVRSSVAAILGEVAKRQQLPEEAIQGLEFCTSDSDADKYAKQGARTALETAQSYKS